ncbi:uncharacterized protein [Procambarus clarkii]|uniref:uncharacterized protein n=1 Tax=Procambarus clarkii TaxID=6728 RepID=UPI003743D18A
MVINTKQRVMTTVLVCTMFLVIFLTVNYPGGNIRSLLKVSNDESVAPTRPNNVTNDNTVFNNNKTLQVSLTRLQEAATSTVTEEQQTTEVPGDEEADAASVAPAVSPDDHLVLDITVNMTGVALTVDGRQVYTDLNNTDTWDKELVRLHAGLHLVTLHQVTGRVMAAHSFMTWQFSLDKAFLKALADIQEGRLLVIMGAPEFTTFLKTTTIRVLEEMGALYIDRLAYKDAWCLLVHKGGGVLLEALTTFLPKHNIHKLDVSPLSLHVSAPRMQDPALKPTMPKAKKQSSSDSHIADKETTALLEAATTQSDRARITAVQAPHAGNFLLAVLMSATGTRLDLQELRIAVALRFAAPIHTVHRCICGETDADEYGLHGLQCGKPGSWDSRHDEVNDIIKKTLVFAQCPAEREPRNLLNCDSVSFACRPAGITLRPWKGGRQLAWDYTCVSTLATTYINLSAGQVGAAATRTEKDTSQPSLRTNSVVYEVEYEMKEVIPVAIVTARRLPHVLRQVGQVWASPGGTNTPITIFVDGHNPEAQALAALLHLPLVQHHNPAYMGSSDRVNCHMKYVLAKVFQRYPQVDKAIILEDDLQLAPDFIPMCFILSYYASSSRFQVTDFDSQILFKYCIIYLIRYFHQTAQLLTSDPKLLCVNAYNSNAFSHTALDPTRLYRVHGAPAYGWMVRRQVANEMINNWAPMNQRVDWDLWTRQTIMGDRDILVPEIPRTKHRGGGGVHVTGIEQEQYYNQRPLNALLNVTLDLHGAELNNYLKLHTNNIRTGHVVHFSKHPCVELPIPRHQMNQSFVVYVNTPFEMSSSKAYYVVARCLGLDDHYFFENLEMMFTTSFYGNQLYVIGCPNSPFCMTRRAENIYSVTQEDVDYATSFPFRKLPIIEHMAFRVPTLSLSEEKILKSFVHYNIV